MRCDQFAGLNERAQKIVEGGKILLYTEEITRKYPDGRIEAGIIRPIFGSDVKVEPSGDFYQGIGENEYPLNKYTFSDGRVIYEQVQAEPWSSGPIFFLALQDEEGNWIQESLWTKEEIMEQS